MSCELRGGFGAGTPRLFCGAVLAFGDWSRDYFWDEVGVFY